MIRPGVGRQDGADVEVELLGIVVELARFEELTDGVTDEVVTVPAEVSVVLEPVKEDKDVEALVPLLELDVLELAVLVVEVGLATQ
ncbi:hypothetical protein SLS55_000563 [Diplodia seriata]|uniref:Uncharacterized protein n=1 Tax=Diplodia seriata TaxID=420778 RepID=A0ABR3CXL1_9PEZI